MSVSKRLKMIISLVSEGLITADIGTDHGYVPISLLREGKVPKAIAVDVSPGSLTKALVNAVRAGLCVEQGPFADKAEDEMDPGMRERMEMLRTPGGSSFHGSIDFRLADGLSALAPGEAECIVISGMGGILMREILNAHKDVSLRAKELILSPHRDPDLIKEFLAENGFEIVYDGALTDKKKTYRIFKGKRTDES